MKIERVVCRSSIDVKRLYTPYRVETECPSCKKTYIWDGRKDYLSFPILGEPEALHFYCSACDSEWSHTVKLDISLEVVPA